MSTFDDKLIMRLLIYHKRTSLNLWIHFSASHIWKEMHSIKFGTQKPRGVLIIVIITVLLLLLR